MMAQLLNLHQYATGQLHLTESHRRMLSRTREAGWSLQIRVESI